MADEKLTDPVYAILDVETTGLSRKQDRIVQIACLKIGQDDSKKTWMRYVNPEMDRQYLQQAFRIHHIPPEFLQTKPLFKDVAESFCDFLKDVDYLIAHNCMFDWDMLSREFEIIDQDKKDENSEEDISKLWWEKFHCEKKWVDTLRLTMLCFPKRDTYRLDAIKEFLKIEPQQGMGGGVLSQGDYGGDEWKSHQHDAMYDVFTTYGVLQHCIKSTFCDLIKDYPMALLDTPLLLDIQRLIDQNSTCTQDLLPFAQRSKEYFTTSRPKGKKLGDLSKGFLERMTVYSKADARSDDRVILIYEAAILEPLENDIVSHSASLMMENVEKVDDKKEEDVNNRVEIAKRKKEEQEKRKYEDKRVEEKKEKEIKVKVELAKEVEEERIEEKIEEKSEGEIVKEMKEEQEKRKNMEKEQRIGDKMEEDKGEAEIVMEMKDEKEKRENVEKEERIEDKMEEDKGETEIVTEMKDEKEKRENVENVEKEERIEEKIEEKNEGDKSEGEIVKEMKEEQEKRKNVEKEERIEDKMEDKGEAEIAKEMKDEKEKREIVEKEERIEDKMEEDKGKAEIAKEIKEEQEKRDKEEEENLNCSSQKRPKLSLY